LSYAQLPYLRKMKSNEVTESKMNQINENEVEQEDQIKPPELTHPPLSYLSRIHSKYDAMDTEKVSYQHGHVHDIAADDLIQLKNPNEPEENAEDQHHEASITAIEVLYGDEVEHQQRFIDDHKTPTQEMTNIVTWDPLTPTPISPKLKEKNQCSPITPLLKK